MRLWHYKLLPYIPNSQLIAQWRELNSIFKNQNRHILINYVYAYDKEYLRTYTWDVLNEMRLRGIKIHSIENMEKFFGDGVFRYCDESKRFAEHDDRYLRQCFYNLQEKYDRGQMDFEEENYLEMLEFVKKEIGL